MQKQSQDEYRNAVGAAIVSTRADVRAHRDTMIDHAVMLDQNGETMEDHATDLGDHETRIGTCEDYWESGKNMTCGVAVDNTMNIWCFVIGVSREMYYLKYTHGVGWATSWVNLGGTWTSGVQAHYDSECGLIRIVVRGVAGPHQAYRGEISVSSGSFSGWMALGGEFL